MEEGAYILQSVKELYKKFCKQLFKYCSWILLACTIFIWCYYYCKSAYDNSFICVIGILLLVFSVGACIRKKIISFLYIFCITTCALFALSQLYNFIRYLAELLEINKDIAIGIYTGIIVFIISIIREFSNRMENLQLKVLKNVELLYLNLNIQENIIKKMQDNLSNNNEDAQNLIESAKLCIQLIAECDLFSYNHKYEPNLIYNIDELVKLFSEIDTNQKSLLKIVVLNKSSINEKILPQKKEEQQEIFNKIIECCSQLNDSANELSKQVDIKDVKEEFTAENIKKSCEELQSLFKDIRLKTIKIETLLNDLCASDLSTIIGKIKDYATRLYCEKNCSLISILFFHPQNLLTWDDRKEAMESDLKALTPISSIYRDKAEKSSTLGAGILAWTVVCGVGWVLAICTSSSSLEIPTPLSLEMPSFFSISETSPSVYTGTHIYIKGELSLTISKLSFPETPECPSK